MPKTKLPICKTCEREATEVYDFSYNKSYFCHFCRVRVISEEEIQAWFDSGPIKNEFLQQWLGLINKEEK
jgi:hypothetical protein